MAERTSAGFLDFVKRKRNKAALALGAVSTSVAVLAGCGEASPHAGHNQALAPTTNAESGKPACKFNTDNNPGLLSLGEAAIVFPGILQFENNPSDVTDDTTHLRPILREGKNGLRVFHTSLDTQVKDETGQDAYALLEVPAASVPEGKWYVDASRLPSPHPTELTAVDGCEPGNEFSRDKYGQAVTGEDSSNITVVEGDGKDLVIQAPNYNGGEPWVDLPKLGESGVFGAAFAADAAKYFAGAYDKDVTAVMER